MAQDFVSDCWPMFVFVAVWIVVGVTEPPTAIAFLAGAFGVLFCWLVYVHRERA